MRTLIRCLSFVLILVAARWNPCRAQCSDWSAQFHPPGIPVAVYLAALTSFDDGSGPALYVGGNFVLPGVAGGRHIARWDGSSWSALGSGLNGQVYALAVFDDGSGPALYAGGAFTASGSVSVNHVARWNGSAWSPLGSGTDGPVFSLQVFDDGSGPALHAGGTFATAGGVVANRIAKWQASSWVALGLGVEGLRARPKTHELAGTR